jgi:hypothetical protein
MQGCEGRQNSMPILHGIYSILDSAAKKKIVIKRLDYLRRCYQSDFAGGNSRAEGYLKTFSTIRKELHYGT